MAQTALAVQTLKQNNYAVIAGDLAITFAASDNVNGNSFLFTGQEILLVQNADGASAHTFTISSVSDSLGRVDTSLVGYSVPLSSFAAIQLSQLVGWLQPGNTCILASNSAQIKFAVLRKS